VGCDNQGVQQWHDVPDDKVIAWRVVFEASTEGSDLRTACPICRQRTLHRWFFLHRDDPTTEDYRTWAGPGSQWQWCSSCCAYEHSSGLVPIWWQSDLDVDPALLVHDPGPIEAARQRKRRMSQPSC
jgi:hypothetical protein